MNKFLTPLKIAVLVIFAVAISACNNPHAAKTNVWTGDRTWAQTTFDAQQKCAELGLTVLGINPDTGDPTCGSTGEPFSGQPAGTVDGSAPASSAPELPTGDELMSVCEFTTADAKAATGVDVQRIGTEPCGFVWRAVDKATENAVCPKNMVCTFHLSTDKKVVVKGNGKSYSIVAGTFRIASAYPLDDAVRYPCRLLAKEQAFGASENPSFTVEAGNFSCP